MQNSCPFHDFHVFLKNLYFHPFFTPFHPFSLLFTYFGVISDKYISPKAYVMNYVTVVFHYKTSYLDILLMEQQFLISLFHPFSPLSLLFTHFLCYTYIQKALKAIWQKFLKKYPCQNL